MAKDVSGGLTWADSAAANTAQTLVGADPGPGHQGHVHAAIIHVHNPSTITALTIQPRLRWTDNVGVARDSNLGATFSVPVNSTVAQRVEGFGMGLPIVHALNATALGAGQGFTARVRVEFFD